LLCYNRLSFYPALGDTPPSDGIFSIRQLLFFNELQLFYEDKRYD